MGKIFCPDCLVPMEMDFDWSDTPTMVCPRCGSHHDDRELVEATPLSDKAIAEKRKRFIACVKEVLCGSADHFYIPFHNDAIQPLQYSRGPWLTGEWEEEDGKPYVCAYLVGQVYTDGYAKGDVFADAYIDKGAADESIGEDFDYLISGLDPYGCRDGKLVSAKLELQRGRIIDGVVYP